MTAALPARRRNATEAVRRRPHRYRRDTLRLLVAGPVRTSDSRTYMAGEERLANGSPIKSICATGDVVGLILINRHAPRYAEAHGDAPAVARCLRRGTLPKMRLQS